jgi:hypothetical protein
MVAIITMTHPFIKLFDVALKKSRSDDNIVLRVAEDLIGRGYPSAEVLDCLGRFEKSLIAPAESKVVAVAREVLEEAG